MAPIRADPSVKLCLAGDAGPRARAIEDRRAANRRQKVVEMRACLPLRQERMTLLQVADAASRNLVNSTPVSAKVRSASMIRLL
ncbi:MAG: hypothetical protein CMO80_13050 [Verrucomicrobiales bacterium]|nr:hypothetical protein [Verrucomicrobiales bacterium]